MSLTDTLKQTATLAMAYDAFSAVECTDASISCIPAECEGDATYRIEVVGEQVFAMWVSPDRYLSQSIESDLMWTGDDLDDCIDEELVDQGWSGGSLGGVEHFRDERMLYVFRSSIPLDLDAIDADKDARSLVQCLLAYEATFRELGDMSGEDD